MMTSDQYVVKELLEEKTARRNLEADCVELRNRLDEKQYMLDLIARVLLKFEFHIDDNAWLEVTSRYIRLPEFREGDVDAFLNFMTMYRAPEPPEPAPVSDEQ